MAMIRQIAFFGPLMFAFGFLMPLTSQIIERVGWVPPFDLSPLVVGGIIALLLGVPAQIRGRWV